MTGDADRNGTDGDADAEANAPRTFLPTDARSRVSQLEAEVDRLKERAEEQEQALARTSATEGGSNGNGTRSAAACKSCDELEAAVERLKARLDALDKVACTTASVALADACLN